MATKNFIGELEWRGMIHTIMPGAKEQLDKEMTTAYLGIDPTADSLHIGHLVGVMILKHFQMCGHRPIALVGGATGMIGDPSGKSQERNLLDEATLRLNQEAIKRQLSKLLNFDSDAPNAALMVNNYDWMKEFSFLDFIRDIGKLITVNYMMAKDSVKKRFSGEGDGMSFTEFSYQLVQGYDFMHLYEKYGCKIQLGGSDQWGNITTGTELIRRKLGAEAYAITCPLITKADGTKFGKTESGNVWLDPRYTSPYKFYQFWLNVSDEDAKRYIRIFTLLDRETIERLTAEHDAAPHLRILQKRLAEEITVMIHSREEYEKAVEASQILFGGAPYRWYASCAMVNPRAKRYEKTPAGLRQYHALDEKRRQNPNGKWMLTQERINVFGQSGPLEQFLAFYQRFVADSLFQVKSISSPLRYVTTDPEDDFGTVEGTLDVAQWQAFKPQLPDSVLTNVRYGQTYDDPDDMILVKAGISNGLMDILYFKKRRGAWKLVAYEN